MEVSVFVMAFAYILSFDGSLMFAPPLHPLPLSLLTPSTPGILPLLHATCVLLLPPLKPLLSPPMGPFLAS